MRRQEDRMHKVFAQIIGEPEEWSATCHIQGSVDFEQAAESQVVEFIQNTGGDTKRGAVLVWTGEGQSKVEKIFDWQAEFTMPDLTTVDVDEDEEFEVDGGIELTERT